VSVIVRNIIIDCLSVKIMSRTAVYKILRKVILWILARLSPAKWSFRA